MYKEDLALNNPQELRCYKTKPYILNIKWIWPETTNKG